MIRQFQFPLYAAITFAAVFMSACYNTESLSERENLRKCNGSCVQIETTFGTMVVELFDDTPQHRDNFLKLVDEGYYDGLLFHRVIETFMVQGGDPNSRGAQPSQQLGMGGPGYTIEAEIDSNHVHIKGALSAARQGDQVNPERRSSGSQFYLVQGKTYSPEELTKFETNMQGKHPGFQYSDEQIEAYATLGGTPHLDMEYTVFGRVIEGIDIIDSIAAVKTGRGNRPVQDVVMNMEVMR